MWILFQKRLWVAALLLAALVATPAWADPNLASLSRPARNTLLLSMSRADRAFDPSVSLIRAAGKGTPRHGQIRPHYSVRASSWYALGLLLRNHDGDRGRALQILNAVLAEQYHAPGKPWNGTFRRTPEEPAPGPNAVMWRDFDPNWREFIGTTFALILKAFPDRIPPELALRMNQSIVLAVQGEIAEGRLVPTYTNPALMYGYLWSYAASFSHNSEWVKQSSNWQQQVYHLYKQYDAFNEFNSPTYCGVDLYALSLWEKYGLTPQMRAMGAEMEAGLWRNLASFYDADLKNISGPFDRSYGMDMNQYVSIVGLVIRMVLGPKLAPFPSFDSSPAHAGDLSIAPAFAVLGIDIPADALREFRSFRGKHPVRKQITARRVATAWLGPRVMYGGESTEKTRAASTHNQFHPATVQWKLPNGRIGWIRLTQSPPLNAVASKHGLKISCKGDVRFLIHAPGAAVSRIQQKLWQLPGLKVRVASNASQFTRKDQDGAIEVEYFGITGMDLTFTPVSGAKSHAK